MKRADGDDLRIEVGVSLEENKVIIQFSERIRWIGIAKHQALDLANSLIECAEKIKGLN